MPKANDITQEPFVRYKLGAAYGKVHPEQCGELFGWLGGGRGDRGGD